MSPMPKEEGHLFGCRNQKLMKVAGMSVRWNGDELELLGREDFHPPSFDEDDEDEENISLGENKNTLNLDESKDTLDDEETQSDYKSTISDVDQNISKKGDTCTTSVQTSISVEENGLVLDSMPQSDNDEHKKPAGMVVMCPNERGVGEDHEKIDCAHLRQQNEILKQRYKNWHIETNHFVMDDELPPDDDIGSNLQDEEDPDGDLSLSYEKTINDDPNEIQEEVNDYESITIEDLEKLEELELKEEVSDSSIDDESDIENCHDSHQMRCMAAVNMYSSKRESVCHTMMRNVIEMDQLMSEIKDEDDFDHNKDKEYDEMAEKDKLYIRNEKIKLGVAFFIIFFVHLSSCIMTVVALDNTKMKKDYREKIKTSTDTIKNSTKSSNVTSNDNDYTTYDRKRIHL